MIVAGSLSVIETESFKVVCGDRVFKVGSLTLSQTTNFRLFQTERVCR